MKKLCAKPKYEWKVTQTSPKKNLKIPVEILTLQITDRADWHRFKIINNLDGYKSPDFLTAILFPCKQTWWQGLWIVMRKYYSEWQHLKENYSRLVIL